MAQYFEDWSDKTVGEFPEGWDLAYNQQNHSSWLIVDDNGQELLRHSRASHGSSRITAVVWEEIDEAADIEITCLLRTVAGAETYARHGGVTLRYQPNNSGYAGVVSGAEGTNGGCRIEHFAGNDATTLTQDQSLGLSSGQWYWLRMRAVGPLLLLKRWEDGSPEPETWTLELHDTRTSDPGLVGMWSRHGTQTDYAFVGVGTGGDPAPMEPVGEEEPIHLEALSTTATAADARLTRRARLSATSGAVSAATGDPVRRIGAAATAAASTAATGSLARSVHLSAQSVTTTGASLQASTAIRLRATATVTTSASAGLRRRVQPVGITEVTSSASGTLVRRVRTHSRAATYTGATGAILRAVRVVGSARGASAAHATLSVGDPLPHPTTLGVTIEDIYTLRVTIEDTYTLRVMTEDIYTLAAIIED